jgi:hypothetical protein
MIRLSFQIISLTRRLNILCIMFKTIGNLFYYSNYNVVCTVQWTWHSPNKATNNSPRSTCSYYNLTTPDGDVLFPTSEDVLESCMSGTLEIVTNTPYWFGIYTLAVFNRLLKRTLPTLVITLSSILRFQILICF